jgi:hypothetical protein
MKWAKRLLLRWVKEAQIEACNYELDQHPVASIREQDDTGIDMDTAVRFAILPARGGCVMEIKTWDKKEHEWMVEAHIIPEGDDIAHRVGQLVALEFLRR